MSFRNAYGNDWSENGWRMCDSNECDIVRLPNLFLVETAPIRKGAPLTILGAWLKYYDTQVDEITSDTWGWSRDNAVETSNHLAGTAVDVNASKWPWGTRTMPADLKARIRKGLALFEGSVFWGADWDYADEMHFQMAWPEGDARNELFALKLEQGYLEIYTPVVSTPAAPIPQKDSGMTAETLSAAMGGSLSLDRYRELLPAFTDALIAADCTTVNRAAMFCAQVGHESSGLLYMREIASGDEYDTRSDLGNTPEVDGDGRLYAGRGPIQVTGRAHYAELSEWAHANGFVPTPTYFVDNPAELETVRYGFLGAVWYWTVSRNMNGFADSGDIVGASYAVNGGDHGLDDRIARWNRCLELGTALLPATQEDEMTEEDRKMLREVWEQLRGETGAGWESWRYDELAKPRRFSLVDFVREIHAKATSKLARLTPVPIDQPDDQFGHVLSMRRELAQLRAIVEKKLGA